MKRLALLGLVVGISAVAGVAGGAHRVVAAETHTDCIQFDSGGNVIGLTPNCSMTVVQAGGQSQSFPAANPCTGDTGTVTLGVSHQVFHININGALDGWDTGTQTGSATFTPDDPTAASGSGTNTGWFGDSFNMQNLVQHFTMSVRIHLSDGTNVTVHGVGHISFSASNSITPVVAFDKKSLNFTCG